MDGWTDCEPSRSFVPPALFTRLLYFIFFKGGDVLGWVVKHRYHLLKVHQLNLTIGANNSINYHFF